MAKTKYPTDVRQLTHGELQITIYPHYLDSWQGTSGQLIEAGLIPEGFDWPVRTRDFFGMINGFETALRRVKKPGGDRATKWAEGDYWYLARYCADRSNAAIYKQCDNLRREIWRVSAEGREQFARYWRAREDKAFQRVKTAMLYPGRAHANP